MSSIVDKVILPLGTIIRDFKDSIGSTTSVTRDVEQEGRAIGLDFFIRNRGAAALTVSFDGQAAITVDPGDVYRFNDTMFTRVAITSTVTFDAQVFGVLIDTLIAHGIIKGVFM